MEQQQSFPAAVMMPAAAVRAHADTQIERVAEAAERRIDGWCETACKALREFAAGQALPFTIELARGQFADRIAEPHDLRAWGKVTRMAMSRGYIVKLRGQFFEARSSHGSPKQLYAKGPQA